MRVRFAAIRDSLTACLGKGIPRPAGDGPGVPVVPGYRVPGYRPRSPRSAAG